MGDLSIGEIQQEVVCSKDIWVRNIGHRHFGNHAQEYLLVTVNENSLFTGSLILVFCKSSDPLRFNITDIDDLLLFIHIFTCPGIINSEC